MTVGVYISAAAEGEMRGGPSCQRNSGEIPRVLHPPDGTGRASGRSVGQNAEM